MDPNYNATFASMYDMAFERAGGTAHIRDTTNASTMGALVGMLYMTGGSAAAMAQVLMPVEDSYTAVLTVNIDPNVMGGDLVDLAEGLDTAAEPT